MRITFSYIFFSLFAVMLATYSLVTLKDQLLTATMEFSIILLLTVAIIGVVDNRYLSFTYITPIVVMLVVATHYATGALSSYLAYNYGMSDTTGVHSIVSVMMHDIASAPQPGDPLSIIGLALLNGLAEEFLFTGTLYGIVARFSKAKYLAAFIAALAFALFHTQSYLGVTPLNYILNVWEYRGKSLLLLSPMVTQLVKCGLFQQEMKRGGGLLGVSVGHAAGNGILLLAYYGYM